MGSVYCQLTGRGECDWGGGGEDGDYSGISLIWTHLGQKKVSWLVRCPDFRGYIVHKNGIWDSKSVCLLRCPRFRVS